MPLKRLAALVLVALLATCSGTGSQKSAGTKRLTVVTTMSTLASLVEAVAGDRADVVNLVPVGVSPEDYQPTPKDIATLHDATVLIENGTGLEAWLAHTVDAAKNPSLRILVCTDGMPVKGNNPHLWMNPVYAKIYVSKIAQVLSAADPGGTATYRQNLARYRGALDTLDA
ncbi:MAG: zinc ABC transporter substrate-binding protein, partial [Candidatus Eremiobacteraeota bacterium]|nr:zinc ABC transporter substrate-binding protein [Candidatus Eremiobacteraeota bacterium]